MTIKDNLLEILRELPDGVELEVAGKTRKPEEMLEAVETGATIIGENYVQEAERARALIGDRVKWHLIGHLQSNKVKKAVRLFDMIESVDSVEIAREIDKRCRQVGKFMPVLVEVNIGREPQKSGVLPERVEELVRAISAFPNVRVMGLMTIEPRSADHEGSRCYFKQMKNIFERIKNLALPNVEMRYLSMGMSDSYRLAIEQGANLVRIGSKIFRD